MDFIKNSFRELKHVVWPTKDETRKYFLTVLTVLILFGIYLFATGTLFKEVLFAIKDVVSPATEPVQVETVVQPEVNIETENTEKNTATEKTEEPSVGTTETSTETEPVE